MDSEEEINDNYVQSMERDVTEHGVTFTHAALSGLLNKKDENEVQRPDGVRHKE